MLRHWLWNTVMAAITSALQQTRRHFLQSLWTKKICLLIYPLWTGLMPTDDQISDIKGNVKSVYLQEICLMEAMVITVNQHKWHCSCNPSLNPASPSSICLRTEALLWAPMSITDSSCCCESGYIDIQNEWSQRKLEHHLGLNDMMNGNKTHHCQFKTHTRC